MSGMTNSATMGGLNLLPDWVRALWITAYVVILIIHLYHAATMKGEHRAWHSIHILMALGMIWMFLPTPPAFIPALAWQIAFALAALLIVVWFIWSFSHRRAVNFLWVTSLIAVLAMIYMFAFPGAAIRILTYILVVYFVAGSHCLVYWRVRRDQDRAETTASILCWPSFRLCYQIRTSASRRRFTQCTCDFRYHGARNGVHVPCYADRLMNWIE